jgi:hypothetical protein
MEKPSAEKKTKVDASLFGDDDFLVTPKSSEPAPGSDDHEFPKKQAARPQAPRASTKPAVPDDAPKKKPTEESDESSGEDEKEEATPKKKTPTEEIDGSSGEEEAAAPKKKAPIKESDESSGEEAAAPPKPKKKSSVDEEETSAREKKKRRKTVSEWRDLIESIPLPGDATKFVKRYATFKTTGSDGRPRLFKEGGFVSAFGKIWQMRDMHQDPIIKGGVFRMCMLVPVDTLIDLPDGFTCEEYGKPRLAKTNWTLVVQKQHVSALEPLRVNTHDKQHFGDTDDDEEEAGEAPVRDTAEYTYTGDCFAIAIDPETRDPIDAATFSGPYTSATFKVAQTPEEAAAAASGKKKKAPARPRRPTAFAYVDAAAHKGDWKEYASDVNLTVVPVPCRLRFEDGYVPSKNVISRQANQQAKQRGDAPPPDDDEVADREPEHEHKHKHKHRKQAEDGSDGEKRRHEKKRKEAEPKKVPEEEKKKEKQPAAEDPPTGDRTTAMIRRIRAMDIYDPGVVSVAVQVATSIPPRASDADVWRALAVISYAASMPSK